MSATTHPDFNGNTTGIEVAKAFADGIHGKNIIVTGVNHGGIGYYTAQAFASQSPAHLIITGRDPIKLQDCAASLKSEYPNANIRALQIDLSSQKSVRAAASEVLSWTDIPEINILVNSAGVGGVPERTLTEDGVEMHFATNHIGHWLFTCLLMPKFIKAAKSSPKGATRIINVSSKSPATAVMRWSDINFDTKNKDLPEAEIPSYERLLVWGYTFDFSEVAYIPMDAYDRSKVANVLFGIGANKRLYETYGILTTAVHPGIIHTDLARHLSPETIASLKTMEDQGFIPYKTKEAGSSTSLVAALDPKLHVEANRDGNENYGAYLSDCQISTEIQPLAVSSSEAEKLWKLSEKLVKQDFVW